MLKNIVYIMVHSIAMTFYSLVAERYELYLWYFEQSLDVMKVLLSAFLLL